MCLLECSTCHKYVHTFCLDPRRITIAQGWECDWCLDGDSPGNINPWDAYLRYPPWIISDAALFRYFTQRRSTLGQYLVERAERDIRELGENIRGLESAANAMREDHGLERVAWIKPAPSARLAPDDITTPAELRIRSEVQLLCTHDLLCAHITGLKALEYGLDLHTVHLTHGYTDAPFTMEEYQVMCEGLMELRPREPPLYGKYCVCCLCGKPPTTMRGALVVCKSEGCDTSIHVLSTLCPNSPLESESGAWLCPTHLNPAASLAIPVTHPTEEEMCHKHRLMCCDCYGQGTPVDMMVCLDRRCCTAIHTRCNLARPLGTNVARCPHCAGEMGVEDTEANRQDLASHEPSGNLIGPLVPPSPSEIANCQIQLQQWRREGVLEPSRTPLGNTNVAGNLLTGQHESSVPPSEAAVHSRRTTDDAAGTGDSISRGVDDPAPILAFPYYDQDLHAW